MTIQATDDPSGAKSPDGTQVPNAFVCHHSMTQWMECSWFSEGTTQFAEDACLVQCGILYIFVTLTV